MQNIQIQPLKMFSELGFMYHASIGFRQSILVPFFNENHIVLHAITSGFDCFTTQVNYKIPPLFCFSTRGILWLKFNGYFWNYVL